MKKILIGLCVLGLASIYSSVSAGNTHDNYYKKSHNKHRSKKLDKVLSRIIKSNSLTGNPLLNRTVPDINSPQAQLGMDLFFSKTLGGEHDSACVTCHHPVLGGGDNLSLPIGVEADNPDLLGSGRTNDDAAHNPEGGPPVPRNAPTTFNLVAWDKFQFHDGRIESLDKTSGTNGSGKLGIRTPDSPLGVADPLAGNNLLHAQARFPVTSNEEMKGFDHANYNNQSIRELLAGRLGGYGDEKNSLIDIDHWLEKFRLALLSPDGSTEQLITEQNVSMLIAEYERSQVFINTPWKRYIEGEKRAISRKAKKGAILFYSSSSEGGANCSSCHAGDFFTDESFHNLAMPQIGPGKGDNLPGYNDGHDDFGREQVTKDAADRFKFRTPSLRQVAITGPWGHDGAYNDLEQMVRHHLNPVEALNNYDINQALLASRADLDKIDIIAHQDKKRRQAIIDAIEIKPIKLTDEEIYDLMAFLHGLTDVNCIDLRKTAVTRVPSGLTVID
jgi:cytochrome c peroxidase